MVDDNIDAAKTLGMMLTIMGNETCLAYDGVEAVAKAASFQPEIILLDLGLPHLERDRGLPENPPAAGGRADRDRGPERLGTGRGQSPHARGRLQRSFRQADRAGPLHRTGGAVCRYAAWNKGRQAPFEDCHDLGPERISKVFALERSRPAADLLAQVELDAPRRIVDLGCGTGWLARAMAERWPEADVIGIDNSPEMLAARRASWRSRAIAISRWATLPTWSPDEPVDLLVSNAALQWLADHERLLGRLAAMLAPGACWPCRCPTTCGRPSHQAIYDTAAEPRFAQRLSGVGLHRDSVRPVAWYAERLHRIWAWRSTPGKRRYIHVLTGENPVLEWLRGTALRPVLAALRARRANPVRACLGSASGGGLSRARDGVTLFEMSRVFFVARR